MSGPTSDGDEGKVLQVAVPGRDLLTLRHLVLDLNGTLAVDGRVVAGVAERLDALRAHLQLHVLTAGTHGHMEECATVLGLQPLAIGAGTEKRDHVRRLGPLVASVNTGWHNSACDMLVTWECHLCQRGAQGGVRLDFVNGSVRHSVRARS